MPTLPRLPRFSRLAHLPWSSMGLMVASAAAAALMVAWSPAYADDAEAARAESPYFFVKSDDPSVDRLPLKSTDVKVRIAGVIADVTVIQHYRNEGKRPLEARYVFPGSTQAAVYAMNVRLGDRLLTARIREKEQARVEYQAAKSEGKTAALLEQQRANVFQMQVANILPGDDVAVELHYTELLVPTEGRYQFVFPTVVGPRYHVPQGNAPQPWVGTPHLRQGEETASAFDLQVTLDAPLSVKEMRSASHAIDVKGIGQTHAQAAIVRNQAGNNRDFILDYRLAGDRIESGLMLYKGNEENFFLAMVEPPHAIAPAQINPREYIFVVDVSGSMHGKPLGTAKELLQHLIGSLRPSDTFNVMLFSGSNRMLAPQSVPATRANIDQALATIDGLQGGGGTEIVPALRRIAELPKPGEVSRTVVVVTDGYVSVEREVFELVARNLGKSNVFAFGIGSSVNRMLIEGIARAGRGEPFIVTKPDQAAAQAERLRRMIDSPVLTQVQARFEGLDVYDVEPAVLPDVLGGRPVVVFGKWRGEARGRLTIEGRAADGAFRQALPVAEASVQNSAALRFLWARQRIAALSDQEALEGGQTQKSAILDLGLRYSLLTDYTSFIAVDQVVRNPRPQDGASVDQPAALPEGVGERAVRAEVPGTPEPGAWVALGVTAGVLVATAWHARRRQRGRRGHEQG